MEKKDWKKKLRELSFMKGYYFKLEDNGLVEKKDDQLVFNREELERFVQQELDKAREEGVKMGMENAWEMVSALLDTLDINKNEEEIRILTGINKLFDREITKLALKLKNNK